MDSSRTKSVIPDNVAIDGFSPWQVGRIRDRLSNFKSAVRRGWERIALDILDDMDQDEDYVIAEDVRPFSESLRRLVAGSQTPTDERLRAISIFLGNNGYLGAGDLDESRDYLQAPMAFLEFVGAADDAVTERLETFRAYEGSWSYTLTSGEQVVHLRLSLDFQGRAITAKMTDARLNRIDTLRRLKDTPSVRKRALRHEFLTQGFALGMPNGRMVVFMKPSAYGEMYDAPTFLLWATDENGENEEQARSMLLLDYRLVSKVGDIEIAEKALGRFTPDEERHTEFILQWPIYTVFARD